MCSEQEESEILIDATLFKKISIIAKQMGVSAEQYISQLVIRYPENNTPPPRQGGEDIRLHTLQ